jgi:hypothetical protein
MRDDWMMKTLGHPSSRRKMLITPVWFKNIFSRILLLIGTFETVSMVKS